ncbi:MULTISPECIES: hypothetical protein [Bowdeniella]|uniref:hypothetical protein n=1 Tax=Bowdeniella TaxID=2767322 RepID=UPI00116149BD|nr:MULTISPECIES: hypothetical protein [Bowdeniella]
MKLVHADDFDPVADVLSLEFGCQAQHSVFFESPLCWLIVGYAQSELTDIEILDAVDRVFGKALPSQARIDTASCEQDRNHWRITFYDEPVSKEMEAYSEDRTWHATSSWNATGTLISLTITRFSRLPR